MLDMDDVMQRVREYYDSSVENEWGRIQGKPEFLLTCRMLKRYIKPGDTVLDIGGGPGIYSIWLAEQGCDVTLFDLSPGNVAFALKQAKERGLPLKAICGDARTLAEQVQGSFDHVLVMGPLYHLPEESDRQRVMQQAIAVTKPAGLVYAVFITLMAGIIYYLGKQPEAIVIDTPDEITYREAVLSGKTWIGDAFTTAVFAEPKEISSFIEQFPLQKLHLFSQEGLLAPNEMLFLQQPEAIKEAWLDFCELLWEREELLSWSEHLVYVGRKL